MAREKIETGAWSDGRAKIICLITKEEFLAQEKEFEAVSSDYSELMANNAFKKRTAGRLIENRRFNLCKTSFLSTSPP